MNKRKVQKRVGIKVSQNCAFCDNLHVCYLLTRDKNMVLYLYNTDDRSAVVNVNYEENGAILANIITQDDTYVIEVRNFLHTLHALITLVGL